VVKRELAAVRNINTVEAAGGRVYAFFMKPA
jgi:hypothetical protein